ncbi:ATP-binding protein [Streptomyces sp. B6B3]|uniref:ATP-binding protein n=1 Tax=Streptomyces sp. B6B3 TaxID=3153570 RepID=UPI00325CFE6A
MTYEAGGVTASPDGSVPMWSVRVEMPRSALERVRRRDLAGGLVHHRWVRLSDVSHPQALAREHVRQALAGRATRERIGDAVTVIGELTANAIEHTSDGPRGLVLDVYQDVIVMWIHDGGQDTGVVRARPPVTGSLDELPEDGRGLFLVGLLATKWFVWPTVEGKAVVAVMTLGGEAVSEAGGRAPEAHPTGTLAPSASAPPAASR